MHSFKSIHNSIQELIAKHSLKRVLIGLSGGPDSVALLSMLKNLQIGIAHVDHRWREESERQAEELRAHAEALNIPFYLKVLNPVESKGNLEEACRLERLRFFSEICQTKGYEAVFLGHHQDDLAETVLKRVLEGASFASMEGMRKSTLWNDLLILRPFLDIPKEDLLSYLSRENISFFEDETNWDPRFLRGKMRSTILPSFGKSVSRPLARLSKECQDLNAYMNERIGRFLTQNDRLDCQSLHSEFEVRWLIRIWLKKHRLLPSYEILEDMTKSVITRKGNLKFLFGEKKVEIDRGRLFLRKKQVPLPMTPYLITQGLWGGWKVEVDFNPSSFEEVQGWEAAWGGQIEFFLPKGDFFLQNYLSLLPGDKKFLQKLWTDRKIPAFFREFVPIVSDERGLKRELLTGKEKNVREFQKKVILYLE